MDVFRRSDERQSSLGSFQSLEVFQDDSELYCQFSMGCVLSWQNVYKIIFMSRDGEIYIAGSRSPVATNSSHGLHIIGSLSGHRKSVTCLASSADGFLLVSGSEDGMIRVWDTAKRTTVRTSKHTKG